MKSEFSLIDILRARASRTAAGSKDLVRGIGDDCAVVRSQSGRETILTSDLLVEGIDFRRDFCTPAQLAAKALAVSLSDIAAMGGRPRFSMLSLGIPNSFDDEFWQQFLAGYFDRADHYGVALIGGDISASPDHLVIDSVLIGDCETGKSIGRNGARPGDALYVTGEIGLAAVGLRLLLAGKRFEPRSEPDSRPDERRAIEWQLAPVARVEFGGIAGEKGLAHAMIDVSDGLAQDLGHICSESGVSAVIEFDRVPVSPAVGLIESDPSRAFEFAVSGGEDFELVFAAPATAESNLLSIGSAIGLAVTRIGTIVNAKEAPIFLEKDGDRTPYRARGYDHFAI